MSSENNPQIQEDLILKVESQDGFFGAPLVRQGTVAIVMCSGRMT